MTYRAAMLGDAVLTGPEHQHLSDADLLAEAVAELDRVDTDHATDDAGVPLAPRSAIVIQRYDDGKADDT